MAKQEQYSLEIPSVGTLQVSALGRSDTGRQRYQYVIKDAEGRELIVGDDIYSGCWDAVDCKDAMESLFSFLSAAAEAQQYERYGHGESENRDLFPENVMEWADQHSDELHMARLELGEGGQS